MWIRTKLRVTLVPPPIGYVGEIKKEGNWHQKTFSDLYSLEAAFQKCMNQRQVLKYDYSTADSDLALVRITLYLVDSRVLNLRLIPRGWEILDGLLSVLSGGNESLFLDFLIKLKARA
jgi:hypothetical protein